MTPLTNPDETTRGAEDLRDLARRVDALERRIARCGGAAAHGSDGGRCADGPAAPVMSGLLPAAARDGSLSRRVDQLTRRLVEQERRSAELGTMVDRQREIIRLLCHVIKELDDPYGLGESLDERIGLGDASPSPRDDETPG